MYKYTNNEYKYIHRKSHIQFILQRKNKQKMFRHQMWTRQGSENNKELASKHRIRHLKTL